MSGHLLREMTIAVEQTFDIIASDFFKHRKESNYFSCQVHCGAGIFVVPQGIADNCVESRGSPFAYLSHRSRDFSVLCQVTPFLGPFYTEVGGNPGR